MCIEWKSTREIMIGSWSIADSHFGYYFFCLNLHEKGKYVQLSIQPRLE